MPNIEELRKSLEDTFKKSVEEEKIHEKEKLSDSEKQEDRKRRRKEWNQTYYKLRREVSMSLNKLLILL
jgi:lipoate-protein ligase A